MTHRLSPPPTRTDARTGARAAGLIAAAGLASLSPMQQAASGLAVLGALGLATPAWAVSIPGIPTIVKWGDCPPRARPRCAGYIHYIVAPTDADGTLVLTGLKPGEYEVSMVGDETALVTKAGADGSIAIAAQEEAGRRWIDELPTSAAMPVRRRAISVARAFSITPPTPCARPRPGMARNPACRGATVNYIDVNTGGVEDIVRLAPATSAEAARFIVAERTSGGPFATPSDFANRICPKVSVDFGVVPIRIGDTSIIPRPDAPRGQGWKCAPARPGERPVVNLFGQQLDYVGHVTLLR